MPQNTWKSQTPQYNACSLPTSDIFSHWFQKLILRRLCCMFAIKMKICKTPAFNLQPAYKKIEDTLIYSMLCEHKTSMNLIAYVFSFFFFN